MGDSHHTFCLTCACVQCTYVCSCMFNIIETLHNQSFSLASEDSLRDSKPPVTGYLRGPRDRNHGVSVYETCACVIHTNLLSYIIIVISHYSLHGVHVLCEALVINIIRTTGARGCIHYFPGRPGGSINITNRPIPHKG